MVVVHVAAARVQPGEDAAPELARRLVADVLDIPDVASVRLVRACHDCGSSTHGPREPIVRGVPGLARLSMSRAEGLNLVACCLDRPVGIDVEQAEAAGFDGFAAVALHPDEEAVGPHAQTVTWVRKEAVLKAVGHGLQEDLRRLRLTAPDAAPAVVEGPQAALADLDVGPGFTAAIAVLGNGLVDVRWRLGTGRRAAGDAPSR